MLQEQISLPIGVKKAKILVTRPVSRAQKTLRRFKQYGWEACALPLSETRACATSIAPLGPIKSVIVTSASGFFYIDKAYLQHIKHLPFYCVGSETAKAAQALDCLHIAAIYPDLDNFIASNAIPAEPVLYMCGRRRRASLERFLTSRGIAYKLLELYETLPCQATIDKILAGEICLKAASMLLLTSSYSAQLCNLIMQHLPLDIKFICFSSRIASLLPITRADHIYICATPDEDSAVALIASLLD